MYNRIENLLANVAGVCIAGAVFVTLTGWPSTSYARINDATSPVTINAINALYVANNAAQAAIDVDVCDNTSMVDTTRAGDALTGDDARQYRIVRDALGVAYNASHGGDAALDIVRDEFCAGVGER